MLCKNPFVRDPTGRVFKTAVMTGIKDLATDGIPFPCGQCLPCRINKRRVWTHRLMLESYVHTDSVFVTLTYAPEHLPGNGTLIKRDLQLYLKRLRKALSPRTIRYYAAGEYGEQSYRPHYHLIIFGTSFNLDADLLAKCWPYGLVHVGTFSSDSASYVAGYVTKKVVGKSDIQGRIPEFALMSRKPGIGYPALNDVLKLLDDPRFVHLLGLNNDVPHGLKHGKSFMPFGRYLVGKLRMLMDCDGDIDSFLNEMRDKYLEASKGGKKLVDCLVAESMQRNRQIESSFKIFRKNSRNQI